MEAREDGWVNAVTGYGQAQYDKRLATSIVGGADLSWAELEDLGRDPMAARIVEAYPDEALREGVLVSTDAEPAVGVAIVEAFDALDGLEAVQQAATWGRQFGGGVVVLGVNDGRRANQPLDLEGIRELNFFNTLTRFDLSPASYYADPRLPTYGWPEVYRIHPQTAGAAVSFLIHETRLVRFGGVPVTPRRRLQLQGWDDSVLQRCYDALRAYSTGHDSVPMILQDFTQMVYCLSGLEQLLVEGREKEVVARLQGIDLGRSILKAVVLGGNDKAERQTTSVAGLKDLVHAVEARLVAATGGIPHTVLLGESPGASLGEAGASQARAWYDSVAAYQRKKLRKPVGRMLDVLMRAKNGPTGGKVPEGAKLVFPPLWQPDPKQIADTRKAVAEADAIYLREGVLTLEEVAQSRFGGAEGWSADTKLIDGTVRERPAAPAAAASGAEMVDDEDDLEEDDPEDALLNRKDGSMPKKKASIARYPKW
jgi:uncharacterized protein